MVAFSWPALTSFFLILHCVFFPEPTFDIPIFRFGTTFSSRAYSGQADQVPQAVTPGNATHFDPSDIDELSGLSVALPKQQIGKLVGNVTVDPRMITPNDDGINESLNFFFNLLQLTRYTHISLELYDFYIFFQI